MVIIEPAVAGTRLLDLGSKLYPSNMPRVLNIELTRFVQSESFSSTLEYAKFERAKERLYITVYSIDTLVSAFAKYHT